MTGFSSPIEAFEGMLEQEWRTNWEGVIQGRGRASRGAAAARKIE